MSRHPTRLGLALAIASAASLAIASVPCLAQPGSAGPPGQRPAITTARDRILVQRLVVQTLVALQQANETGDYDVFRALAAPRFRNLNSSARLAQTFKSLVDAKVDLGLAAAVTPSVSPPPFIDASNAMHVQGVLDTTPAPVAYAMVFIPANGVWRLREIALGDARPPN